ncbi:MAG TPA: thioredoxin domain-containing protein [Acidobacteriaceae bacterium]
MKLVMVVGVAMALGVAVPMVAQTKATQAKVQPAPQAPVAQAPAPEVKFPEVNSKNFTAASPTVDEVNGFLKAIWGFDVSRKWQVAAILKTPAAGIAKVVVLVGDERQPGKVSSTVFFTTPDGKHAISDTMINFGPKPFEEARKTLQAEATGAARGAKSNDLMLVEFADLQCESCKDAQDKVDNLAQDFPQARIVFENFPVTMHHPYALRAAEDGVCVRKEKGDAAFFSYVQAVYAKQAGLTAQSVDEALKAAETAAGADPAAVAACAAAPETKAAVEASLKLGEDVGVSQAPTLAVNGHLLSVASLPYETLKQIVAFQAQQDGITVHLQPTLTTLK